MIARAEELRAQLNSGQGQGSEGVTGTARTRLGEVGGSHDARERESNEATRNANKASERASTRKISVGLETRHDAAWPAGGARTHAHFDAGRL